jgi:chorismate mutase/prephenate dehydratase
MEEIKRLRAEIDVIDEEILRLLNKRAKLAKSIGEIKKQLNLEIHSPEREREVIDRLVKLNRNSMEKSFLQKR